MDDFDRYLEFSLSRLLDRVVEAPAPPRRRRRAELPFHAVIGGLATTPIVETVPTPAPVAVVETVIP
jgi:hypothetical protein